MTRGKLRAGDAMSAPVLTAPPTATLEQLAELMLARQVGSVVIVDAEDPAVPVGIVTETDFEVEDEPIPFTFFRSPKLLGKYVWSERSLEDVYALARSRTAGDIMSDPLFTVDEPDDLWEAVRVMVAEDVRHVPVLRAGRLVGIVTRHDLLKGLVEEEAGPARSR
jgi:CBS domain-containing protein